MPRGFWTQSMMVLTEQPPSLDAVREALDEPDARRHRPDGAAGWFGSKESLLIPYRPDVHGWMEIDVLDEPWPDSMGDPKEDTALFAAWTMGAFGPGAFPRGLSRAAGQSIRDQDEVSEAVDKHTGFVRLRISYVIGAGQQDDIVPEDHDPLDELMFMVNAAKRVLDLEGGLALFNPNGEVMITSGALATALDHAAANEMAPLDVFTNLRHFNVGEVDGWAVMDVVGMDQFMLPDFEVVMPSSVSANEMANWLLNVGLYMIDHGPVIEVGHTVEGPGGDWRLLAAVDEPFIAPPRATLRWIPAFVEMPGDLLELVTPPPPAEDEEE